MQAFITMVGDKAVDLTWQLGGAGIGAVWWCWRGLEVDAAQRAGGWRPRIMGVGNRFVPAAVIMQINTAGNLFK